MGGMVSIAIRHSDNSLVSFKAYTGFMYRYINDIKMLDEQNMKNFLSDNSKYLEPSSLEQHENYDDNHALFAPYDYGLILFDYVTKNVFSVNNHSGFLNTGIEQLKNDYNDFIRNKRSANYIFREKNKETVINGLEDKGELFQHLYLLNRTLVTGGNILKDGQIINEPNDTYLTFLERNFGKEITEFDSEKGILITNYSNIQASSPGWTIFVGDANDMNKAYDFIKQNNFNITQEEHQLWQDFIEEQIED